MLEGKAEKLHCGSTCFTVYGRDDVISDFVDYLKVAAIPAIDVRIIASRDHSGRIKIMITENMLLANNLILKKLTELVDNGVVAGIADIPALEREFGPILTLKEWLKGAGKASFGAALNMATADIALR